MKRILQYEAVVPRFFRQPEAGWQIPVFAVTVSAATFLGALGIAAAIGFEHEYLRSRPVYAGVFGLAWSVFWYLWSVWNLPRMLGQARLAFPAASKFETLEREWVRRLERFPVAATALLLVAIWAYVHVATHEWQALWGLPRFSDAWVEEPELTAKNIILDVWSVPITFVTAANVVGVFKYTLLVRRLASGELAHLPSVPVVREAFRSVGRFGQITGVSWTIGVVVVIGIVSPSSFDWASAVLVGVLGIVGFLLVFVPESVLHSGLERLRRRLGTEALTRLVDEFADDGEQALRRGEERLRTLHADTTWVHGYERVIVFAGQFALPLASLAASLVLQGGGGD